VIEPKIYKSLFTGNLSLFPRNGHKTGKSNHHLFPLSNI